MSAHNTSRVRFTIPNGGTDSPLLSSLFSEGQVKTLLGSCIQFVVHTPATLSGTITLQVTATEASGTPVTVQTPAGTDLAFAASKAVPVNIGAFKDMRFHSSGAEGGSRDIDVVFQLSDNN